MIAYLVDLEFLGEDSDYLSIEEAEVEEITDKDVVVLAGGHTRCRVSRFQGDRLYFRTKEAATKVLAALLEDNNSVKDEGNLVTVYRHYCPEGHYLFQSDCEVMISSFICEECDLTYRCDDMHSVEVQFIEPSNEENNG